MLHPWVLFHETMIHNFEQLRVRILTSVSPSRVMQMSRSLLKDPNPLAEDPNNWSLASVLITKAEL